MAAKIFPFGTALTILWHFAKPDGSNFNVEGYTYRLYYRTGNKETEVESPMLSSSGNTITFTIPATAPVAPGEYALRLVLFQHGSLFCRFVYNNAFVLSRRMADASIAEEQTSEGSVVNLYTVAEYYMFSPVIPIVSNNGYWVVNGETVVDGRGNPVPSSHTLTYDEETGELVIDQGRRDGSGASIEQRITSLATALESQEERYTEAETARGNLYAAAEAERNSEYESAESGRETAYQAAEGNKASSEAGDGSRWGEFKEAEGERTRLATEDHQQAGLDHQQAEYDHGEYESDHRRSGEDHEVAESDHRRAVEDHATATNDTSRAQEDHDRAEEDNARAALDHDQAEDDHIGAYIDRQSAESDRGLADSDRMRAESDHNTATEDHMRAEQDHTTAASDHTTAANDHTRAESDHARAEQDHTASAAATGAANEAAQTATEAAEAADTARESIEGELSKKANTDGYYGGMTVGSAENLVGRGSVEAEIQGIRTSAGQEDIGTGAAIIREVRGKSLVWNQLIDSLNAEKYSSTGGYGADLTISDGIISMDFSRQYGGKYNKVGLVSGHLYYATFSYKTSVAGLTCGFGVFNSVSAVGLRTSTSDTEGNWIRKSGIFYPTVNADWGFFAQARTSGTIGHCDFKDVWITDLTLMFGNEPTTVDEFERMFPLPYYEYNEGTIINNEATGLRTRGFNLYNPVTGKAVLPGKYSDYPYEYEICGAFTSVSFEDYAGNVSVPELTDGRFFNVDAPGVLTVVGGNATDTCVHLVWSGWRNYGQPDYVFEPYWENTLPLNIKTITGKLNGEGESVTIYPDGMRGVGTAYDRLIVDPDGFARRAVVRMGERAYAEGDESDVTVVTDKTNTVYPLATPLAYVLDTPIPLTYMVDDFGIEAKLPVDTAELPTGPLRFAVTYPFNAVDKLRRQRKEMVPANNFDQFLVLLGQAYGGTWNRTYDATTDDQIFTYTPPESEPTGTTENNE